mmetsp:Transcript_58649/g.132502  ORF Transcript_58649/g.132502 Transcript_58649/m.132502 type:complete len:200 (+) Transcript_58649:735-1334(+)
MCGSAGRFCMFAKARLPSSPKKTNCPSLRTTVPLAFLRRRSGISSSFSSRPWSLTTPRCSQLCCAPCAPSTLWRQRWRPSKLRPKPTTTRMSHTVRQREERRRPLVAPLARLAEAVPAPALLCLLRRTTWAQRSPLQIVAPLPVSKSMEPPFAAKLPPSPPRGPLWQRHRMLLSRRMLDLPSHLSWRRSWASASELVYC